MSNQTMVSKSTIWDLLGSQALTVAAYLNSTTDADAPNIKIVWDSADIIDLESTVFQNIMNMLLTKSVITQTEVNAVTAKIAELTAPPTF